MKILRKYKLTLGFLLIIFLFLSFGIVTIKGIITIGNLTKSIYHHPLVVSNAALNAALEITKMHRSMKDLVLSTQPDDIQMALAIVSENQTKVYLSLDTIRDNILGEQGQQLERQTRQLFIQWEPIRKQVLSLVSNDERSRAIRVTQTTGADHTAALEAKMFELTSYARGKAESFLMQAEKSQAELEKITIILTLTGVLFSLAIAIVTIYNVLLSEKSLLKEKASLERAVAEIKTLRGILPICSHCKQIRDDEGSWSKIEQYIHEHSGASFSHGICPDCIAKHYPEAVVGSSSKARNALDPEK